MQTLSETVSVVLLGANVIQFIASLFTKSSMRIRMQASYNDWYRVAQTADEISAHPEKASQLISTITGFADSARHEIKAYSQNTLGFVPWVDPPSQGGPSPSNQPPTLWQRIKFVFAPKSFRGF